MLRLLKNALSVKTLKVGKFFSETANVLINTPPDRWQYSPARQLFSEIFLQCPTLFKLFATSRTTTSFQGILNIVTLQMLYTDKANILFWGYSVSVNLLTLPNFCSNEVLHFGFHGNYVVISHKMAILIQFFCCMRFNLYCQQFHSLKVIKNVVWLKRFGICLNSKRIQELNSLPVHLFQDSQHLTKKKEKHHTLLLQHKM